MCKLTKWTKSYSKQNLFLAIGRLNSTMYYQKKGVDKMGFSIRLTPEEKKLAESYARIHSISVGEAFKKALFEKIEEEFDVVIAEEAYEEYEKGGKKSRPITELWKELDI